MHILAGAGVLPDGNIKLALADRAQMDQARKVDPGHSRSSVVMGLTDTRPVGADAFEHSIFVLDHLPPARFAAVCAHEYGHAWMQENVRRFRKLSPNSVEGFCEWLAYKVMTERGEEVEKNMILANRYTRGQIDAFIKAEENLRSWDIIKWIKEGSDNRIDSNDPSRVLALGRPRPAAPSGPISPV